MEFLWQVYLMSPGLKQGKQYIEGNHIHFHEASESYKLSSVFHAEVIKV